MMRVFSEPVFAQASPPTTASPVIFSNPPAVGGAGLALIGALALGGLFSTWQWFRCQRRITQLHQVNAEQVEELQQALDQLQPSLKNPHVQGCRILALDYLRMRMDEEVFRYQILHQVEEKLSAAVADLVKASFPNAATAVLLDRHIDIEYDLEGLEGKWVRCTVLRFHLQLRRLPLQSSHNTLQQMLEAIALFINHPQGQEEWKTPFQDQWLVLNWDTSPQPIPLLHLQNYPPKPKSTASRRPHHGDRPQPNTSPKFPLQTL